MEDQIKQMIFRMEQRVLKLAKSEKESKERDADFEALACRIKRITIEPIIDELKNLL